MRILYINDELSTADGSNYHALGIWNNLQKLLGEENVRCFPAPSDGSGVGISHSTLRFRERLKFPLQLVRIVRKKALSLSRARRIIAALEQEGFTPTHVLFRTILFDTTALSVAKHFRAKLISECNTPMFYEHITLGALPLPGAICAWERKVLSACDLSYAVSSTCRDMLCEKYALSPDKFIVIPNGYDNNTFLPPGAERDALRQKIRRRERLEDCFVITFVGSLKTWHGIDALCRVASALEPCSRYRFLIIGDGPRYEQIKQCCQTCQNILYKGKLSTAKMAGYLYASDLGIMPYPRMDAFYFSPLKLYDMIGAGLPFIGTSQGQIKELCEQSLSDDFLCADDAPEALAEKIRQIAENPSLHAQMQQQVLSLREGASWQARVSELLENLPQ